MIALAELEMGRDWELALRWLLPPLAMRGVLFLGSSGLRRLTAFGLAGRLVVLLELFVMVMGCGADAMVAVDGIGGAVALE